MSEQLLELAQVGYEAYCNAANGKNFDGEPLLSWDELPDHAKHYWLVTANAILSHAMGANDGKQD
ncbi:hypothetical protein HW132_34150 [Brasilonema sp. CT11]|nr:hypothetical protein [Brasilonema sp. CT11]